MKTRIIKTKIWTDSRFIKLSPNARLLMLFLLTSPQVGMTNYLECPDGIITFSTGIKALDPLKQELQEQRLVYFYEGWVFIPNLERHNNYKNSPSNESAYNNEISSIPKAILHYYDTTVDTTVDSTVYSTYNPKTINQKPETINKNSSKHPKLEDITDEDIAEICDKYRVPDHFVRSKIDDIENYCKSTGKKYKDYKATLMNWVKKDSLKIRKEVGERGNKTFDARSVD